MKISFSVLTYNSEKVLSACLDALIAEASANGMDYEINVLNNGSSDNTANVIQSKTGSINYFENPINQSFTKGFNQLLSNSAGDIFCMLSDDVIVSPGLISQLADFYKYPENAKTIIAPKSILPNGCLDRINKKELDEMDLLFGYTLLGSIFKRKKAEYAQTESCTAEVVQDSCLFFYKDIKSLFIFDERYKFYFTEDSLSIKLRKDGCRLLYNTDFVVGHHLKQATKKSRNIKINTIYYKDCLTYSRRVLNPLFHYLILVPAVVITYSVKYVKWKLNPDDYL